MARKVGGGTLRATTPFFDPLPPFCAGSGWVGVASVAATSAPLSRSVAFAGLSLNLPDEATLFVDRPPFSG